MARSDWIPATLKALKRDGAAVLVTQCMVEGSAPREAGAKMLVSQDSFWGTIGGGNLEHQLLEQARSLLDRTEMESLLQDYPLGPLLSQCCGGHVRILLERFSAADIDWLENLERHIASSGGLILETRLKGSGRRKRLFRRDDVEVLADTPFTDEAGRALPAARPQREQCAFFREAIAPPLPPIHAFGAGHVGRAFIQIMAISDFPLRWYDARPEFGGAGGAVPVEYMDTPDKAVEALPKGAICLVFTHAHELDYQLTRAILQRGDSLYCGLIGSRTKRVRFIRRLAVDGQSAAAIARLTCPIGLPEIPGKTPFAIALSVAAQINTLVDEPVSASAAALE